MRWESVEDPKPGRATERWRFALWPTKIGRWWIWLEWYAVIWRYDGEQWAIEDYRVS